MKLFAKRAEYFTYIPIVYHFDKKINLPNVWGFPASDWGIAFVILTDYMKFDNPVSQTVISTCITLPDNRSSKTRKTAEESTPEELKKEVFRQLKEVYPDLPEPTVTLISPAIYRENDRWETLDTAFMFTKYGYMSNRSTKFNNLFNVGCQNGNSSYSFTSMEATMQNAVSLLHDLEHVSKKLYPIRNIMTMNYLLLIVIIIVLILILVYFMIKKN